jgi:hypothetical protein
MRTFLHAQGVPFRIYVAEQMAPGAFNRGWALDVAFAFAEPEVDYVAGTRAHCLPSHPPQLEPPHLDTCHPARWTTFTCTAV